MNTAVKDQFEKQFWDDVEKLLIESPYSHSSKNARYGMDVYKNALRNQAGGIISETVYNQGEEKTAEVIDSIIRTGLPTLLSQTA